MKVLLFGIILSVSLTTFANSVDNRENDSDSFLKTTNGYHYDKLIKYLEGLELRDGFELSANLSERTYQKQLQTLEDIIEGVQFYYDIEMSDIYKSISITDSSHSYGNCIRTLPSTINEELESLEIGIGGDLSSEDYTNFVDRCTDQVIDTVEGNFSFSY